MVTTEDERKLSLIRNLYDTHEFRVLPFYTPQGVRILGPQLPDLSGGLIEFTFLVKTQTFNREIDLSLLRLHVLKFSEATN